ncbi:MAG: CPBP family intramembrane metalloprotease [Chloroflexi bacterium]|nr:CPBP family intramembrane metalloprotease [Chloroflexota bacterium]
MSTRQSNDLPGGGRRAVPASQPKWREIVIFGVLAFLFSWLWWGGVWASGIPLVSDLSGVNQNQLPVGQILIVIGDFGPLVAALVMRLLISKEGLKNSLRWRRSWRYYLVALLAPPLFYGGLAIFHHVTGLGRFVWTRTDASLWSYLGIELLIGALVVSLFVFGEEYGWRGYLLPRLLGLGEIKATAIVGVIWGLWHLPLFAMGVSFPGQNPWLSIPLFVVCTIFVSFPFTWFFRATGGSVVLVSLLHGSINSYGDGLTAEAVVPGANPLIVSASGLTTLVALMVITFLVYAVFKRSPTVPARELEQL